MPGTTRRSPGLDAARGALVILMAAYHAAYVAVMFSLVRLDFWSGFWWWFPRTIAAGFVALSGWGLELKRERGGRPADYLRRAGRLALPALGVSAVSALMFGDSWVFFGVLHLLALSAALAWPFLGRPALAAAAGALVLAGGLALGTRRWDFPWLAWLGFRPEGVYPADYLPLLPWFSWCLFGAAARGFLSRLTARRAGTAPAAGPARGIAALREEGRPGAAPAGSSPSRFAAALLRPLAFLGRHSLAFYLAHLPALYGLGWLVARLAGRGG